MFAGEGGAAGILCRDELHELDAGLIGVVEIELDLSVAAHLGFSAVGAFAVVAGQGGDGVVHVGDAEGEVVHDTGLMERWVGAVVEHVLEPVGAVGDLEADPVVDAVVFGAAVPVGTEAEDLLPEGVFLGAVGDEEAYVDDACTDGVGRWGRGGNRFFRVALDEDDEVAFWVADAELAVLKWEGGLDVVGFEVALELGCVSRGEGHGGQANVGLRRRRGEELDPLRVVDRVEPHLVDFFALEAESVAVELLRRCRIGGVEAGEGNSCDGWALLGQRGNREKAGEQEGSCGGAHGTNCNVVALIGQS